jgi:hypothetical protein
MNSSTNLYDMFSSLTFRLAEFISWAFTTVFIITYLFILVCWGLGFGVWGLGFGVWGLGFGV